MKMEEILLESLARIKNEIQVILHWIDDAPTNRIAGIRCAKSRRELRSLIETHKNQFQRLERLRGRN